jgi:hypothetical protein
MLRVATASSATTLLAVSSADNGLVVSDRLFGVLPIDV